MKKIVAYFLLTSILFTGITACEKKEKNNEKINIVCTMFPQYDWTRELIKGVEDKIELVLLVDNGADIHSYQPTAEDILVLGNCDMAIYTNGVSDEWVAEAIKKSQNSIKQIKMMDIACENEHEEEHVLSGEHYHEDEHVWLSLENAEEICEEIAQGLIEIDAERGEIYKNNLKSYTKKLEALDNEYEKEIKKANNKTLLFADRFPFAHLVEDYDLSYYAAFPGCSAESEASFEVVAHLAEKMEKENLPAAIVIDNGNDRLAKTIIENTKSKNAKIITMKSMQSVKKEEIEDKITYIGIMEENLEALKVALNLRNEEN